MKVKLSRFFICLTMLILLSACSQTSALETGDAAPDFTLKGIDGKNVTLSELKGKVVILDFFASWCPPCKQEIPDFIKLQDEYGSKGFVMIGVSLVNEQETKNFAEQYGINYPVVVDDGKVSVAYGPVRSIPTTYIIDKDLKVAKLYIGFRPKEVFEKDVKELLE